MRQPTNQYFSSNAQRNSLLYRLIPKCGHEVALLSSVSQHLYKVSHFNSSIRNLIFKNWRLKPFIGISYGYDLTDDSIVDMNYVNDTQNYRIILDKLSSEQWNTNLGLEFYKNNFWSGSISYEYEKTDSSSHSNSYQFNLNWVF